MLDHLDDLDADFRRFYGISGIGEEEFGTLSAPRFFALAERSFAYDGVMTYRQEKAKPSPPPSGRADPRYNRGSQDREVPGDRTSVQTDPVLAGLIEF